MKYQLGEFVRFVDEKREGYITKIFNDEMVGVTGDDDFEIPVMVNNLTRVHGHQSNQNLDDVANPIPAKEDNFTEKGVFIAVVPDLNKGSIVHFYLINETSYQLFSILKTDLKGTLKGEFANTIQPKSSAKIYSAALAELDLWPKFHFQTLFYTPLNKPIIKPLVFDIKFRAKDFSGNKQLIPLLKLQGWSIRMDEPELVIDAEKIKESFFKSSEEKLAIEKPAKEIDLHIEKLRDDHDFLDKQEMIEIQLAHFKKNLDAAIVHKLESIVFIHGVGNGSLRHEIHKIISKHPQVKTFMDARKEKFGYGATEVFFK
ncbi:Smr/MutS family protein [Pelobium sp.]|nr:Smr/MutS family protein [Pelobium sp.]MDA9555338.1 Smr/MutS family protein [Pelobium sp.]